MKNIKEFETEEAALKYAVENISKNDYEIVLVNGKKTFLCATLLPIEAQIRDRIESILYDFVKLLGEDPDDLYIDDGINYIGAQMDEKISEMIEERLDVKILSANLTF